MLSVVAQQILTILTAVAENVPSFLFEGRQIKLDPTCGIFVTMNPGYAGRSELPENLKAVTCTHEGAMLRERRRFTLSFPSLFSFPKICSHTCVAQRLCFTPPQLLRPMSMMTPDISLIIEIMLFSEGFVTSKGLAKKMTTLYFLMVQQLSKQDHYDFGLRSIKSVLNSAGALKRGDTTDTPEDVMLLRSIRDMNAPKFIAQDSTCSRVQR